jgi:hypothetical protein
MTFLCSQVYSSHCTWWLAAERRMTVVLLCMHWQHNDINLHMLVLGAYAGAGVFSHLCPAWLTIGHCTGLPCVLLNFTCDVLLRLLHAKQFLPVAFAAWDLSLYNLCPCNLRLVHQARAKVFAREDQKLCSRLQFVECQTRARTNLVCV